MHGLRLIQINFTGTPGRRETILGVEFAIYNVIMLVEGVHQGIGSAPAFYSKEVLAASVDKWIGKPVPVGHPQNPQGDYCLLSDNPALRGLHSVGVIEKAISKNGKLMASMFLQVKKANALHPGLIGHLDAGRPLDVSTGLLAVEDGKPGVWKGEEYKTKILEIFPDHLALLPGQQGACSWQDGCGVRTNSNFNFNGVNDMSEQPYVAPILFAKSKLATDTAIKALCAQHGEFQGRAVARAMKMEELIQLGETILNARDEERQQAEDEVYVPVTLFGGRN